MSTAAIKLKKSSVVGKAPLVGDIDYGEVAINYADGRLYYKDASNNIKNFIDSDLIQSALSAVGGSQNVFSKIAVAGQGTVEADSTGDTLTLVAGSNITLTTNASTDTITISAASGGGTIGSASQIDLKSYTGDSSTTTFAISYAPATEQHVFVNINGVLQQVDAYTITGTSVILAEAPAAGDDVEIRTFRLQTGQVEVRDYASYVYQPSSPTSVFSDSDVNGNVLAYDIGKLDVFLNGSRLTNGLDYTADNGVSVTLLGGVADSSDTVAISSFASAALLDPTYQFVSSTEDFTTTDSSQVVDTYSIAEYRTAKYLVQLEKDSDGKYHATEILLTHNGSNVFMSEYGTITTDSSLGTFDADINSGMVRLLVTPAFTNVSVKSKRISVGA
jgi:hypothetical protein